MMHGTTNIKWSDNLMRRGVRTRSTDKVYWSSQCIQTLFTSIKG